MEKCINSSWKFFIDPLSTYIYNYLFFCRVSGRYTFHGGLLKNWSKTGQLWCHHLWFGRRKKNSWHLEELLCWVLWCYFCCGLQWCWPNKRSQTNIVRCHQASEGSKKTYTGVSITSEHGKNILRTDLLFILSNITICMTKMF